MERLSEREKEEIVRLSAMGLPSRLIGQQIGRHHRTVWGHLQKLRRPAEPIRSRLRLSLREREISRGLAGESRRSIARQLGRLYNDECAVRSAGMHALRDRHPRRATRIPMLRDTTSMNCNYRPCVKCNSRAG